SLTAVFKDTALTHTKRLQKLSFQTESPLLLAIYILNEPSQEKRKKAVAQFSAKAGFQNDRGVKYRLIIQALFDKKKITEAMLPAERFHFLHYFLFYHSHQTLDDLFSNQYLQTIAQKWKFSASFSLKQAMGISTLFKTYYHNFQYSKTLSLYPSIINNSFLPNYLIKLRQLRALDYSMYSLGYYQRSINIMENYAIPLSTHLKKPDAVRQMKISNTSNLYRISKYKKSKQIYKKLLKKGDTILSPEKIKIFNNLAINYYKIGDFSNYLHFIFKSLDAAKQIDNQQTEVEILNNLFVYYRKNGDFNSAEKYLAKALEIALKTDDKKNIVKLIFHKGMLYKEFKSEYKKALSAFKSALNFLSPQKNYVY